MNGGREETIGKASMVTRKKREGMKVIREKGQERVRRYMIEEDTNGNTEEIMMRKDQIRI